MSAPTTYQPWTPDIPPPPPAPLPAPAPPPPRRRKSGPGRHRRARRRPPAWLLVTLLVVVLAGAGTWFLMSRHHGESAATPPPSGEPSPVFHGPLHLTILAVRTEPQPFVSVVGSMGARPPVVLDIPARLVLTLPSGTMADAAQDDPSLLKASVSNLLGTWTEHAAILSPSAFRAVVDDMGGAPVQLDEVLTLDGANVGPGLVTLSGAQVFEYVTTASQFDRPGRWRAVLEGMLSGRPTIDGAADGVEVDDATAVTEALDVAAGAHVLVLPADDSGGGLLVPADARIRSVLARSFGIELETPVDVVVLNGSGVPGVAGAIAEKLVPEGFHIAAAQNAPTFDHKETVVYASSQGALGAGEEAARLLGAGPVTLGGAASGVADITILVGRDFKT